MKTITHMQTSKIIQFIRQESGKAEFVTLLFHDGDFKLNDFGDIAIPSRTKWSKYLDLSADDEALRQSIWDFACWCESRSRI